MYAGIAKKINADFGLTYPDALTATDVRKVMKDERGDFGLHPLQRLPEELRASVESRILQEMP